LSCTASAAAVRESKAEAEAEAEVDAAAAGTMASASLSLRYSRRRPFFDLLESAPECCAAPWWSPQRDALPDLQRV
jgi:hypothetical protein